MEILDISGNGLYCLNPVDYPVELGSVGTFIGDRPLVCGGYIADGFFPYYIDECYTYSFEEVNAKCM